MPKSKGPFKIKVSGSLAFPIDMLRYDGAWPASEEESYKIAASVRHETEGRIEVELYVQGPLNRYPCIGRWDSFSWDVIEIDGHRVMPYRQRA